VERRMKAKTIDVCGTWIAIVIAIVWGYRLGNIFAVIFFSIVLI
jgi:hypothetical protein